MAIIQPQFKISTRPTVKLVKSCVITAGVGGNHETVLAMFDQGWAFNVSAGTGKKKEMRFWPGTADTLEAVLADILDWHSPRWRGEEVCELMQITRALRKALTTAGDLPGVIVGSTFYVTKDTLAQFLTRRVVK